MKKVFIILVSIIICNISVYSKDKINNKSISGKRNNKALPCKLKGITLEVGQVKLFTAEDWQALADSKVTDFVIIPASVEKYDSTEAGYKDQLAPMVIDAINQLVSRRSTARIWIGTPGVTSRDYAIAATSTGPFLNYINYVRQQIGSSKWANNIRGIYMNQESVYGTVDYNNIMGNPTIKLMSNLSALVHNNLKKEFLWIPYYGYGSDPATIIKNIGYVADQTDIFDYVVIQPHYYFDGTVKTNLDGVYNSVKKQNVCFRDGQPVTAKKSKTAIGPEMELDWHIVAPNNHKEQLTQYLEYVAKFIEFKSDVPVVFYWDGNIQNALSNRINQYYE